MDKSMLLDELKDQARQLTAISQGEVQSLAMDILSNVSILDSMINNDGGSEGEKEKSEVEKVKRKLPRWARNFEQVNSYILRTYLRMSRNGHAITEASLEAAFIEETGASSHQFRTNFAQMKSISAKNHGKVFDVADDGTVSIWKPVKKHFEKLFAETIPPEC